MLATFLINICVMFLSWLYRLLSALNSIFGWSVLSWKPEEDKAGRVKNQTDTKQQKRKKKITAWSRTSRRRVKNKIKSRETKPHSPRRLWKWQGATATTHWCHSQSQFQPRIHYHCLTQPAQDPLGCSLEQWPGIWTTTPNRARRGHNR